MTWHRLPDVNGFARWRGRPDNGLANNILANASGINVSVAGRIFTASTRDELEAGLGRLFAKAPEAYSDALPTILEAFELVEPVPARARRHAAVVELREARG